MKSFRFFLLALVCALATSLAQQTTVTPQVGLQIPGYGASNWHVPLNYDMSLLDKLLSAQLPIPGISATGKVSAGGGLSISGLATTGAYNNTATFASGTDTAAFLSVSAGKTTQQYTGLHLTDYLGNIIGGMEASGTGLGNRLSLMGPGATVGLQILPSGQVQVSSNNLRMPAPSQTAASPNFGTSVIPTANGGASYVYGMGNTDGSLSIGQTDPAFSAFMQIRGGNYKTGDASAAVSGIQFIRGTSAGFEQMAQFANTIAFNMPISLLQIPNATFITGSNTTGTYSSLLGVFSDNYTKLLSTSASGGIDLQNVGGQTKVRMLDAGRLLVGTTTDDASNALQVSGSAAISGSATVTSLKIGGASGPTWTTAAVAPTGACTTGSLYTNTAGGAGTTLYVCQSAAWVAK